MTKNHDGTDEAPLVASLEDAVRRWKRGEKAVVVFDLAIDTGPQDARQDWKARSRRERLTRRNGGKTLDDELPF